MLTEGDTELYFIRCNGAGEWEIVFRMSGRPCAKCDNQNWAILIATAMNRLFDKLLA